MEYLIYFVFIFLTNTVHGRLYHLDAEIIDDVEILNKKNHEKFKRTKRETTDDNNDLGNITTIPKEQIVRSNHQFPKDSNNVAFVYWKNSKANVVFILTCQEANTSSYNKLNSKGCNSKTHFYRSQNHGETYEKQDFNNAFIHSIYLSPLDKSFKILTDYINKTLYITHDEGVNYEPHKVNFSPTFVHFHPSLKNYLAAFDNSMHGKKSLYVSEDTGKTWKLISNYVLNYFWAEESIDTDLSLIHFEKESDQQIDEKDKTVFGTHLYVSRTPYLPNLTHIVLDHLLMPHSVYLGKEFIIVQSVKDKKLYVCHNRDKFYEMSYDDQSKAHVHHVILSVHNNEIILGILHDDSTMSLYLSDREGRNLYLLQKDILSKPLMHEGLTPKMDFYEIKGIQSSYIVNKKKVGTLITHDKGLTWNKLVLTKGHHLQPTHCAPNCSLVLFIKLNELYSDFTAPILSKESSPGVIIAQGYIGKINDLMSRIQSEHFVYMSTDGGYTWSQTLKALYGYAILDHGGLIAATPLKFTINHFVTFTYDYGKTWFQFHMTSHYSRIAAIISESSSKLLVINVFGFLQEQGLNSKVPSNTWIVWQFKFDQLFKGPCNSSDYITWQHDSNKCVLGEKTSSKRRKVDNICINGPSFSNNKTTTTCPCTYDDFDCDVGYSKIIPSGKRPYACIPINVNHTSLIETCDINDTYMKSRGYYKLYGNKCAGGIENEVGPLKTTCPMTAPVIIEVTASSYSAFIHDVITFDIKKVIGYHNTNYTWSFGDGDFKIQGYYKYVKTVKYSYEETGHYNITLKAENEAGISMKSIVVKIYDNFLEDLFISYDVPIMKNFPSNFVITKFNRDGDMTIIKKTKQTKYGWFFDETIVGENEISTNYVFPSSGPHKIEVLISKGPKCKSISKDVYVFERCIKIRLRFSERLDQYNTLTNGWLNDLKNKLKTFLLFRYNIIDRNRLILAGRLIKPTEIEAYICDHEDTIYDANHAQVIAKRMSDDINHHRPIFNGYELPDIKIISAQNIDLVPTVITGKQSSTIETNSWIYIILALALVVIALAILIYYKKKRKDFPGRGQYKRDSKDNLVLNMDEPGDVNDNKTDY